MWAGARRAIRGRTARYSQINKQHVVLGRRSALTSGLSLPKADIPEPLVSIL